MLTWCDSLCNRILTVRLGNFCIQPVVLLATVFHTTQTHTCHTTEPGLKNGLHFFYFDLNFSSLKCWWIVQGDWPLGPPSKFNMLLRSPALKSQTTHLKEQKISGTEECEARGETQASLEFRVSNKWKPELTNNCCLGWSSCFFFFSLFLYSYSSTLITGI